MKRRRDLLRGCQPDAEGFARLFGSGHVTAGKRRFGRVEIEFPAGWALHDSIDDSNM